MKSVIFSVTFVLFALFASKLKSVFKPTTSSAVITQVKSYSNMTDSIFDSTKPKTPVYFFSHGGPTFMYPNELGSNPNAHRVVKKAGKTILEKIKPNFIVVVSAHWESHYENTIEVAVPGQSLKPSKNTLDPLENSLIYDFGGFSKELYEVQFHSKNNLELAHDIKDTLIGNGFNSKLTQRGLDHGVWVPLKVAFSANREGELWDIDVPLVQVSLNAASDDFALHRKLGNVLAKYRELGGVVICSGQTVHNLRDWGLSLQLNKTLPYANKFSNVVSDIMKTNSGERFRKFESLKTEQRELLYKAHPSLEHFVPLIVASGAAEEDPAKELLAEPQASLAWGVYQLGKV